MRIGRNKKEDPATRKLEKEGLMKFHSRKQRRINKEKIKEFGRITYDFWSGVKYIVILSALLWWIPLFGPMLAGYVGGRRTGGPKKGLVASIVALFVIGLAYYMLIHGFLSSYFTDFSDLVGNQLAATSTHTLIAPYYDFLRYYWSQFFTNITTSIPFGANNYVLTIIFAYIGGILSLEKRKEYTEGVRSLDRVKNKLGKETKAPSRDKKVSYDTPRKSLKNLEAVKANDSKKRTSKNESDSQRSNQKRKSNPNRDKKSFRVEHHTKSNGDDWQLL